MITIVAPAPPRAHRVLRHLAVGVAVALVQVTVLVLAALYAGLGMDPPLYRFVRDVLGFPGTHLAEAFGRSASDRILLLYGANALVWVALGATASVLASRCARARTRPPRPRGAR